MDQAAKQQIVERVKQASNILVTVSNNPSVDQLSACIGLTLLLNKMDKHATAVFSGQVPSTIEFLQPEKTIETNTDSLRDFIISLDKNKADKLRYKVEDQVVRIFITPYKTSLSEKDLVFSQGDFNVEVVLALGVSERSHLDAAITAQGRILHDATVIALEAGKGTAPNIGQINWQDPTASSLCEMLVGISEAFGTGLIDNQMATAFLTGIVAETHRFSNDKTSPRVMSIAAQLMAAGANQQLIVSKLEPPPPPAAVPQKYTPPTEPPAPKTGVLNVSHHSEKNDGQEVKVDKNEIRIDEKGNLITNEPASAEAVTDQQTPAEPVIKIPEQPLPVPQLAPAPVAPAPANEIISTSALPDKPPLPMPVPAPQQNLSSPIPGPHTLLNPNDHQPTINPPFTADTKPEWSDPFNTVPLDPLSASPPGSDIIIDREGNLNAAKQATAQPSDSSVDSARGAVQNAINTSPFDPGGHPLQSLGAQPLSSDLHNQPGTPPPAGPPPLTTASGAVIPNPPTDDAAKAK